MAEPSSKSRFCAKPELVLYNWCKVICLGGHINGHARLHMLADIAACAANQ